VSAASDLLSSIVSVGERGHGGRWTVYGGIDLDAVRMTTDDVISIIAVVACLVAVAACTLAHYLASSV
jgi:hypothetical protein